jgi:hypothetical protein
MTKKDKWISSISFISLLYACTFLWFGAIYLAMKTWWCIILVPINMTLLLMVVFLVTPYMKTWQDWADTVKKGLSNL